MFVEILQLEGSIELVNMESGVYLRLGYHHGLEAWVVSIHYPGRNTNLGEYGSKAVAQRLYDNVKSKWVGDRTIFTHRYGC